jgi:hypothetical protein
MKKWILPVIFCISFFVYGEEDAPSTIELIIPPVIIEFDDRLEQVLELKLPEYDDIILPDFEISIPEPEEMTITDIGFELPLPGIVEYDYTEKASFFSEGVLGIGNRNHLIGNISLYRLGKGIRFSLLFAHDGLDGFGQNEAGEGFFSRKETFEGEFRSGNDSFTVDGSGSFVENEDGLQGQVPSFSSIIHRLSKIDFGFLLENNLIWDGRIGLNSSGKTIVGEIPDTSEELLLSISSSLEWQKKWFNISLQGEYVFDQLSGLDDRNIFKTDLELGFTLNQMDLSLKAGLQWIPGLMPIYPFSVSLNGTFTEFFQYQSSAGYLVNNYFNYGVWKDYSFFDISAGIDKGWFWDAKISITPFDQTEFGLSWGYSYMDSFMTMDPDSYNPVNGQYSVSSFQGEYLDLSPFVNISLHSKWNLKVAWDGQFLMDKNNLKPLHSVFSELLYNSDYLEFNISGKFSLDPFIPIPDISIGIDFPLTDGITLGIEGEDILGFFAEERVYKDNYINEGGSISLLTRISL